MLGKCCPTSSFCKPRMPLCDIPAECPKKGLLYSCSSLGLVVFFLYSFPLFLIKSSSFGEWWAVLVSNQIFIGVLSSVCTSIDLLKPQHWLLYSCSVWTPLLYSSPKWEQDCSVEGIADRGCLFFFLQHLIGQLKDWSYHLKEKKWMNSTFSLHIFIPCFNACLWDSLGAGGVWIPWHHLPSCSC